MLQKFRFLPISRPIYKNLYRGYGSGPSVYLDFHLPLQNLPWDFLVPENGVHLKKNLPVTWNAPSFDRTYFCFPSIKLNGLTEEMCYFLLVQTFLNQVFFEFLKNINLIKFW
jgi:hypothetical protein